MMIVHGLVLWSLNENVMMIVDDCWSEREVLSNGRLTTCYWGNTSLNNMN